MGSVTNTASSAATAPRRVFVRDGAVDLGGVAYDRHSSAAPKSNGTGRGVTWPADPILVVGGRWVHRRAPRSRSQPERLHTRPRGGRETS